MSSEDDGYQPAVPGDNDLGWHKSHTDMTGKVMPRGSLDSGSVPMVTHKVLPGKVAATVHVAARPPKR